MGRFKPGVKYIYERACGIIYAREFGNPVSQRFEIGRESSHSELTDINLLSDIVRTAKHNNAVKEQFEVLKTLYYLSKDEH